MSVFVYVLFMSNIDRELESICVVITYHHTAIFAFAQIQRTGCTHFDFHTQSFTTSGSQSDVLRMAVLVDEKHGLFLVFQGITHGHSFCGSGGLGCSKGRGKGRLD